MATRKRTSSQTRRSRRKSVNVSDNAMLQVSPETSSTSPRFKRNHIIIAVLALLVVVLFAFKGLFVVAMVNGAPISRLTVVKELEKQGGKQILQSLVTRELILQEAKKRNITISQKDIDEDLAKIEENYKKQGQTLDQVLKMYGVKKEDVIEQRRPWVLLDKMIGEVAVSDKEVSDFIAKNNEAYGGTLKPADVKKDLASEKLKQKEQEFVDKLQKSAKIDYFVQY